MTPHERETTVTVSDGSLYAYIWTCQRKVITKLRKYPDKFDEIDEGEYADGTAWAEFRIPAVNWNPATGAKRNYKMSEEDKSRRAERMRGKKKLKTNAASLETT